MSESKFVYIVFAEDQTMYYATNSCVIRVYASEKDAEAFVDAYHTAVVKDRKEQKNIHIKEFLEKNDMLDDSSITYSYLMNGSYILTIIEEPVLQN